MAELRLGTSGWSYPEWVGRFYPNGTQAERMLDFYARIFTAVEAHSTYRRLPAPTTMQRWTTQVPPGFRFVPKAHMAITHRADLEGVEERMAGFFAATVPLGTNLGPILFSLPHAQPDLGRLDRLLSALPPNGPVAAFDLKPGWYIPAVLDRLAAHGATAVVTDNDRGDAQAPEVGPILYVRLRRERYDRGQLESWGNRLSATAAAGTPVYAFLKHDDTGDGPRYARRLCFWAGLRPDFGPAPGNGGGHPHRDDGSTPSGLATEHLADSSSS
ncbi:MAG: DUF72 domain-containing protein [Acidimicrobiales bacterium]